MDAYSLYDIYNYIKHITQTFENPAIFQYFKLGINQKKQTPTFQPWPIQANSFHLYIQGTAFTASEPLSFQNGRKVRPRSDQFHRLETSSFTIYFSQRFIIVRKEVYQFKKMMVDFQGMETKALTQNRFQYPDRYPSWLK